MSLALRTIPASTERPRHRARDRVHVAMLCAAALASSAIAVVGMLSITP
jgi:hypothetical protein